MAVSGNVTQYTPKITGGLINLTGDSFTQQIFQEHLLHAKPHAEH